MTTLHDNITKEQAWARLRDNEHVKRAIEVALAGKPYRHGRGPRGRREKPA